MKSKLFNKNLWLESDEFLADFKKLMTLDVDALCSLPEVVVEAHLANTSEETDAIFSTASQKLSLDEGKIRANFQIIGNFVREFSPEGDASADAVDDILSDLIEVDLIENKEKVESFLRAARETAKEKFHTAEKKKEYQNTGLPTLVGISGTCNLRAVFDKPYKSNIPIQSYTPKCEGLIPVATLKLRLDSDSPLENVFFQMTPREISLIKNHLEAIEKQMNEMTSFVKDGVI